jgi:predicted porin
MGLGAAYKMGKNVLKAQYFMRSNEGDSTDATTAAVGWDYKFSKRTTAYIAYAVTDNDDNVNYSVNKGGHGDSFTPANGADPSGISVGMIHNF